MDADSDEDLVYEEVPLEDFQDLDESDGEETLDKAVRSLHEKGLYGGSFGLTFLGAVDIKKQGESIASFTKQPEVVDDYIRNYMSSKGLKKSLEAFQVISYLNMLSRMNGMS